jgi:hypothetical protein
MGPAAQRRMKEPRRYSDLLSPTRPRRAPSVRGLGWVLATVGAWGSAAAVPGIDFAFPLVLTASLLLAAAAFHWDRD